MKLKLPYPPSANRYWRVVHGRPVKSADARTYQQKAKLLALTQGATPMRGHLVVSVAVFRPAKRGDLDNTLKVALDALNGIAWDDDAQVVELHAVRFEDPADPRLVITVEAA